MVKAHEPLVAQQLPCGGRQGFTGWHVRPAVHVLPTEQVDWNDTTHPPSEVQQVPVAGQGVGLQVWLAMKRFGKTHCESVVSVHVPAVLQHAPFCAMARDVPTIVMATRIRA